MCTYRFALSLLALFFVPPNLFSLPAFPSPDCHFFIQIHASWCSGTAVFLPVPFLLPLPQLPGAPSVSRCDKGTGDGFPNAPWVGLLFLLFLLRHNPLFDHLFQPPWPTTTLFILGISCGLVLLISRCRGVFSPHCPYEIPSC